MNKGTYEVEIVDHFTGRVLESETGNLEESLAKVKEYLMKNIWLRGSHNYKNRGGINEYSRDIH